MSRNQPGRPTNAELKILTVLWKEGPCTVRQVHEKLGAGAGYTTILKLMQIMVEKRLLRRNESDRTHVYEAAVGEAVAKRNLVRDLMERAFRGSAKELILQALSAEKTSREELAEIRRMIEEIERKKS